jgi:hypothetical protein
MEESRISAVAENGTVTTVCFLVLAPVHDACARIAMPNPAERGHSRHGRNHAFGRIQGQSALDGRAQYSSTIFECLVDDCGGNNAEPRWGHAQDIALKGTRPSGNNLGTECNTGVLVLAKRLANTPASN